MFPALDVGLKHVDMTKLIKQAADANAWVVWQGPACLIFAGFILRLIAEWLKESDPEGETKANFWSPIKVTAVLIALLAGYEGLTLGTINLLSSLGQTYDDISQIDLAFSARLQDFVTYSHNQGWFQFSLKAIPLLVGYVLVIFGYAAVVITIAALKFIQVFMLSSLIHYGPLVLGFASFGPLFVPFAFNWFLSLIEVSLWTASINFVMLAAAQTGSWKVPGEGYNLFQELGLTFLLTAAAPAAIVVTSMLIRGQSAAALTHGSVVSAAQSLKAGIQAYKTSSSAKEAMVKMARGPAPLPAAMVVGAGKGIGNLAAGTYQAAQRQMERRRESRSQGASSGAAGTKRGQAAPKGTGGPMGDQAMNEYRRRQQRPPQEAK